MAKRTHEQYERDLHKATGGSIRPAARYLGALTKSLHACTTCAWQWEAYPSNLLQGLSVCPSCTGKRIHLNTDQLRLLLKPRQIRLLGEYTGARNKTEMRCMKCRYEWEASPDNVLRKKSGCPACAHETRNNSFRGTDIRLRGRTYRLQGFEPQALEWIRRQGGNVKKLLLTVSDGKPTVHYQQDGKRHLYIPDFYYAPKNRIVEVKSVWTLLGRYNGLDMFAKNKLKARAVIKAGYDFTLLAFDAEGQRVKLPKNWYELSRKEVKAFF